MVNVIMVVLDSMRFDYALEVPALLDLAGRGWWFDRIYAPSSFTNAIMYSIRSGMYPPRQGWRTWPAAGPFREMVIKTLEDFLEEEGYAILTSMQWPFPGKEPTLGDIERWIVARQPFFLYLHCWQLHDICCRKRREVWMSRDRYRAQLSGVSGYLGRVSEKFGALGLLKNTLWVVFGDHGVGLHGDGPRGEGEDMGAGQVCDFRTRVPCVIWGAGIKPRRIDAVHSLIDLFPTILDLLGIAAEVPEGYLSIQGHSVLKGERPPVYMEAQSPYGIWPSEQPNVFGATDGRIKVMITPEGECCYDLVRDPQEQRHRPDLMDTEWAENMLSIIEEVREG